MKRYSIRYHIQGIGPQSAVIHAANRWLALQVLQYKTIGVFPVIQTIRQMPERVYRVTPRGFRK